MANRVNISSLAQKDLMESSKWFNDQTPGLGERFAEVIQSHIHAIAKDPLIYKKVKNNIRQFIVNQFSYVIIYEYKNNTVKIIRVFHTSRNPKLKYKRSK